MGNVSKRAPWDAQAAYAPHVQKSKSARPETVQNRAWLVSGGWGDSDWNGAKARGVQRTDKGPRSFFVEGLLQLHNFIMDYAVGAGAAIAAIVCLLLQPVALSAALIVFICVGAAILYRELTRLVETQN